MATGLYIVIVLLYVIRELYALIVHKHLNVPKFLVIAGTLLWWYFGIVYYSGDMAFTLLNVVKWKIKQDEFKWKGEYVRCIKTTGPAKAGPLKVTA